MDTQEAVNSAVDDNNANRLNFRVCRAKSQASASESEIIFFIA